MVLVELHVSALERSTRFYRLLGFDVVERSTVHAVLRRADGVLRLQSDAHVRRTDHHFGRDLDRTPRGAGVEVVVEVGSGGDVDDIAARVRSQGAVVSDPRDRPWGARDVRVTDPDGYFVRISTPVDWGPAVH